uniref:Uncharacterized protein n=1 Tax=Setaria viridis TaxID=4556 RepID=A0A4U6UQT6_SETVI|nr:hypothetical protein SEVIR_5G367850v2 [Setaria viridis]
MGSILHSLLYFFNFEICIFMPSCPLGMVTGGCSSVSLFS